MISPYPQSYLARRVAMLNVAHPETDFQKSRWTHFDETKPDTEQPQILDEDANEEQVQRCRRCTSWE